MPKRTDTRERVLRTAAALFRTQGYHATGLNQVLAEGGAPKGSLYFHFPGGKQQLAVESLELSAEQLHQALRHALDERTSAADGLDAVVEALGANLVESDFRDGCPIATVALDVAASDEPIRLACDRAYESWEKLIAEFLVHHGIPADRAQSLATMVLAAIEGALLLAKTRHDLEPLDRVRTHLRLLISQA